MIQLSPGKLAELCHRYDIALLRAFGSVARGEDRPDSDLDLLVRFRRPKSLLELVRIEREMSEELGRRVDLVTEASLSPYLRERVLRQATVLYDRAG